MSNAPTLQRPLSLRNAAHRRAVAGGRPELAPAQVLAAAASVDAHAGRRGPGGRPWTPTDTATMVELDARSWTVAELGQRRVVAVPAWLGDMEVTRADGTTGPLVPRRRGGGMVEFVASVLQAQRSGALGLLLSYEEAAALARVSVRTWARWVAELQAIGVLRVMHTWAQAPVERAGGRERDQRRNLYRVGPTLEAVAGPALDEGRPGQTPAVRRWTVAAGTALRRRAAEHRRSRTGEAWAARAGRRGDAPLPNCSATTAPHPGPSRPGDTAPGARAQDSHDDRTATPCADVLPFARRAARELGEQPPQPPEHRDAERRGREHEARRAAPASSSGSGVPGNGAASSSSSTSSGPPPGVCPELWAIYADAVRVVRSRACVSERTTGAAAEAATPVEPDQRGSDQFSGGGSGIGGGSGGVGSSTGEK